MSLRLNFCMKAIKTLGDRDIGTLTDGIESYVKGGMETQAAERAAVNDMLAQVKSERQEIQASFSQQYPEPAAQAREPLRFDPDIPFMRKAAIDQTQTPAFKAWFGESATVDEDGAPARFYHGTASDFDSFDVQKGGSVWNDEASRIGIFFTRDADEAGYFAATAAKGDSGQSIVPAYVRITNPLRITEETVSRYANDWLNDLRKSDPDEYDFQVETKQYAEGRIHKGLELAILDAKARGKDGAIVELDGANWAVAFRPEQIKSAIGNRGTFDPNDPRIAFARTPVSAKENAEDVRGIVDAITDTWANAPDVVVLETFDQAPESVKALNDAQLQGGSKSVPAAFVSGGKVYIVADQMENDGGVVQALFHEALGHLGLRGTFGPKLGVILDELADANQEQVAAKAKQYGLDMTKAAERRAAAEEVLAEMAEKSPEATWVQRAIAAIKDFLRKLGIKLKYSDGDIVAQFIVPARRFVTEGAGKPAGQGGQEAMARVPGKEGAPADQTQTPEFKAWFGSSKVVDDDGRPRVVYHGTGRPDRVGGRFRKDRATSGPMQYFTDDPNIGSNYATGKADTSIGLEDEASDYKNWFRIQTKDGLLNLEQAWAALPASEKVKIRERAPQIKVDDDTGKNIIHDPKATRGNGGYRPTANPLMALKDAWLDSGALFDDEQRFINVLKLAGVKANIEYESPHDTTPAVIPVYLSIQKPFVVADITIAQVETLRSASHGQKAEFQGAGVDQWDKTSVSGPDWMERLDSDMKNGTTMAWTSVPDWVTNVLVGMGYDGIQDTGGKRGGVTHGVWVPFGPKQIKSAIGNRGTFDPDDPRIAFMRIPSMNGMSQESARNLFLDAVTSHGNVSTWGKTVGTQYHKAQKNPQTFGRVFAAVQDYIKDISVFANSAADKAPTILPKLENWRDLKKGGFRRHGADPKDLKAAGSAVFQGTLEYLRGSDGKLMLADTAKNLANRMNTQQKGQELFKAGKVTEKVLKMWQGLPQEQFDTIVENKYDRDMLRAGVVFTDEELVSLFKLTPQQIGLYREFRASVDQSLTDLVKTEMLRIAGKDGNGIEQAVREAGSVEEATNVMLGHFTQLGYQQPARKDALDKTYNLIAEKGKQVDRLKAEGYAPLMRFGRHTLHITKDGETVFFGMYESRMDANQAAREMRKDQEFKGAEFRQGLMSQEAYKLYSGMSLEALELFADSTGNSDNPVYQDYLKLAKSNRSAMKRMIHRQGTAGFSEDVSRVLASFVTSNSRMASGNLNLGEAKEAAEAIPKEMGDLKDDAVRLVQYVQDPQEEAPVARGLLFTVFIGGSVASAAVNLTQPMTMTLPYLSQFGGIGKAGLHILTAARLAASGKVDGETGDALKRAEDDGIVSPQEIHHLQAEAMGRLGAHPVLKKAAFIWGSLFSLAEQFNRRVSFISAYNVAKGNHIGDPFAFAERAVIETQGLYNKGNKANWARGPIGATVMTFKQFSTHYLEFLQRMATAGEPGSKERMEGRKAVATALAILMLVAGSGGLPFADDLDDLIDTLAQAMGYDFNAKTAKRKFIAETLGLGDVAAELVTRGATSLPGMPIDLSVRMGLGNLLPGTGALLRSNTDRSRDVLEFAGAAGSLAKSAVDAGAQVLQGEPVEAALRMAPVALQNMAKSVQMWNTGEYRNQKDQKVTDVDQIDAAAKFIGFQPAQVARESASMSRIQRSIQLARNVEEQIAAKWAQGANDLDQEKVAEARQELADWNAKNPDTPINITPRQIIDRVRAMRMSRADRTIKSAPRELRATVREALQ